MHDGLTEFYDNDGRLTSHYTGVLPLSSNPMNSVQRAAGLERYREHGPLSRVNADVVSLHRQLMASLSVRCASFANVTPTLARHWPARSLLVMATTIAVYDRFIMFAERIECIIEHRIHQRRVRACSYRPAYNLAIKAVDTGDR
jgi:hypothetical protein